MVSDQHAAQEKECAGHDPGAEETFLFAGQRGENKTDDEVELKWEGEADAGKEGELERDRERLGDIEDLQIAAFCRAVCGVEFGLEFMIRGRRLVVLKNGFGKGPTLFG